VSGQPLPDRIRTYWVHYEGFQGLSTACSFLPSQASPGARPVSTSVVPRFDLGSGSLGPSGRRARGTVDPGHRPAASALGLISRPVGPKQPTARDQISASGFRGERPDPGCGERPCHGLKSPRLRRTPKRRGGSADVAADKPTLRQRTFSRGEEARVAVKNETLRQRTLRCGKEAYIAVTQGDVAAEKPILR
jgi:hypothetical protein